MLHFAAEAAAAAAAAVAAAAAAAAVELAALLQLRWLQQLLPCLLQLQQELRLLLLVRADSCLEQKLESVERRQTNCWSDDEYFLCAIVLLLLLLLLLLLRGEVAAAKEKYAKLYRCWRRLSQKTWIDTTVRTPAAAAAAAAAVRQRKRWRCVCWSHLRTQLQLEAVGVLPQHF